ncbi:MAG: hypothetical protein RBT80_27930 [Candidatus Vecturithrix sp.]|jgi:hypothetical protein|nr:hypothetical protein [Candidatus Vecturithrix sp.]
MQDGNIKMPFRKACPVIILAVLLCLITTTTYGGNKKMEQQPLYDFKDSMTIEPKIYKINRAISLSLFPVPFDNAVATNSLSNAVTVLSFPDGKLRQDNYFRNVVSDMRGSGIYLPVISKDKIGFALGRLFLLFNFKTEKAKLYRLAFSIGKTPEKMAIADADNMRFLVEVEAMNNRSDDPWDVKRYLQLIELVGDKEVKLMKEIPSDTSTWSVSHRRIFLWNLSKEILQIYDMNLEPAKHPLGDVIKRNKTKYNFTRIYLHPSLRFAIFAGGRKPEVSMSWNQPMKKEANILFGDDYAAIDFSFSPDGKWVTFQKRFPDPKSTYLMPVSEQYPHFLGMPILLIDDYFNPNKSAWTNNPVGFVANDGEFIFRWELTKEAQRSMMGDDFDKYETFHDWIVAKDLEKLTKEKKQGLK